MPRQAKAFRNSFAAAAGLLVSLTLPSSPGWALGNNMASYTYTGHQKGLTTNTVYTLSTYGPYLGACALTPNSTTQSGYSANCYTNYGNQNPSLYSAITFLGTVNNPNNAFVVGDNSGKISIATQNWSLSNEHWITTSLSQTQTVTACPEDGAVSNLAIDPNGSYLYIGCSINKTVDLYYPNGYSLNKYYLYKTQINPDGTLGSLELVKDLFDSFQGKTITAALWDGVSPVMRAYAPNSDSLKNSAYAGSGAVMISGLIGGLTYSQYKQGLKNQVPISSGVICSHGQCKAAYNFILAAKDSFSVVTAAEAGIDQYSTGYGQALYWNQVAGKWSSEREEPSYPEIQWSKTSNTVYSCNLSNNPIGSPVSSCGPGSYALSWPAQGMPAAGKGMQVDISNLLFIPTPNGITTPDTQGLLIIGTWTNGYLAYHSPARQNTSTALFLSGNGTNGEVGNINSLMNDSNGNLLFATNASGLFVFNPFGGQNTANGDSITLIPNESDSSSRNGCTLCKIADATEILYYSVETIATLAAADAPAKPPARTSSIQETNQPGRSQPPRMAPAMLARILGPAPYHGEFRYSEQQLQSQGVKRGMLLRGLRFRSAQGISPRLDGKDVFQDFTIRLRAGKQNLTVLAAPITVSARDLPANAVYPGEMPEGAFHTPLMFQHPFRYQGGDLILRISHSGRNSLSPIILDALMAPELQRSKPGTSTLNPAMRAVPLVRFVR